jgi:hypothetical protein
VSATWWAISGDTFLAALRRAHAGESPDILYAEYYANSDTQDVPPSSDAVKAAERERQRLVGLLEAEFEHCSPNTADGLHDAIHIVRASGHPR